MTNGNGLPWKKISTGVGILVGIFALIGGVFGAQTYMENKYAEDEDIEHIMMMVVDESEETLQLIAMNARSIQLNQDRLEQKIIEDRIFYIEKKKDRITLKPDKTHEDREDLLDYDRDIRKLEREMDNIGKDVDIGQ